MILPEKNFKNNNKAFSILEVIVVLIIVSVMLAYAVPGYQTYINRTKQRDVRTQLILIHGALKVYWFQNGQYPVAGLLDKTQLNNTLGINLTSPDVTFRYTGTATDYTACGAWALAGPNDFSLRVEDPIIQDAVVPHNPCCRAGLCYPSMIGVCGGTPCP